jgi:MFS family permease
VVILLAGAAVEISSNEWKQFLGGVIVVKLGVGIAQTTLITYVSEIAPFQIRGTMIGAYQLFLGFGQLLSAVATKIIVETNPDVWRPLMATEFIFSGLFIIMLPFIPESHVHHARKGNVEAAKRSLQKLYGTAPNYDMVSNNAWEPLQKAHQDQDYEYEVIKRGIEAEEAFSANLGHSSYLEIFQGINLKRTLAGMVGILCQPFTGGPIIWGYSTVGDENLTFCTRT